MTDRLSLFATPVYAFYLDGLEELNRELAERLLAEAQTGRGMVRSNVGGWHSVPDLSQRPEPCYRALMQMTVEHVSQVVSELAAGSGHSPAPRYRYGVHGWALLLRQGDYALLHDHGEAHLSTVYYVDAGDDPGDAHPESGQLAFVDPRRGGRPIPFLPLTSTTFTIRPHEGLLVVFPSWLQHCVLPYRGVRPRISISCNLVLSALLSEGESGA